MGRTITNIIVATSVGYVSAIGWTGRAALLAAEASYNVRRAGQHDQLEP